MSDRVSKMSVQDKLRKARVTLDRHIEERAIRHRVDVDVGVEGTRGVAPVTGELSFDQLKSGGYIKQRQKDLFTVRCRCPGGRIPAAWLRAMADVAEAHGSGWVHTSFRQSVEIPFVHVRDFQRVAAGLAEAGAKVASCGPRVRVPTACAGCEYNPNGLTDTQAMAALVDREFFAEQTNHKFKISFSGCPIDCARTNEMDLGFQGAAYPAWNEATCNGCTICAHACLEGAITPDAATGHPRFDASRCLWCADCIRACPTGSWTAAATGWIVRVGGRHGRHPHNGATVARFVPDEAVPKVVRAAVGWYREHGSGRGRTRIGDLLREDGAMESFRAALLPAVGRFLVHDGGRPEPIVIHRCGGEPPPGRPGA